MTYDQGWTWGDLAGELWAMGIDPDTVEPSQIHDVLYAPRPEIAANCIYRGVPYDPPMPRHEDEY